MENNNKPKGTDPQKDSLGLDVKKSPWLIFALLQIPIVIIMLIFIYVMYNQMGN